MGHGGLLVPVSPREVAVLSGPFGGRVGISPLSRDRSNGVIGGGDVHRSSTSPSFSGSKSFCAPPRRPEFASERKESMTAWWLVAIRILERGDNTITMVTALAYGAKVR